MDLSRRTAWLVLAMLQRPDGHRQLVEFKVWCYQASDGSEQFLWEFRRLLDCVDLVPPSMYLHQWVRKNRPAWDALWAEHGLDSQAVLVPSSKAEQSVARRDERLVNDSPLVRSEWSITTRAALTLFLHMAAGARKVAHRRSCSLLLEAFVSALVPLSFAGELQRMMRNDEVVASCQIDSVAGAWTWVGATIQAHTYTHTILCSARLGVGLWVDSYAGVSGGSLRLPPMYKPSRGVWLQARGHPWATSSGEGAWVTTHLAFGFSEGRPTPPHPIAQQVLVCMCGKPEGQLLAEVMAWRALQWRLSSCRRSSRIVGHAGRCCVGL